MSPATRGLLDGIIKARQLLLQSGAPVDGLSIRIHPADYMTLGLESRSTAVFDVDAHGAPSSLLRMPFVKDIDVPIGTPIVEQMKSNVK